jgi:hypothetical protein
MSKALLKAEGASPRAATDCLVCAAPTCYYFSKVYRSYPGSPFQAPLKVDYGKCPNCGFVLSYTHRSMPSETWAALNASWHHYYETHLDDKVSNAPPYAEQALALQMLARNGLVDLDNALDYAAGYGSLSRLLSRYFDRHLHTFDRYVRDPERVVNGLSESELTRYGLVINSAMFEHVLDRAALDEVNSLVTDTGVLMLHTVVCERVPRDPNWFYLAPMVHTAFHTNRSMSLLMEQWGYGASVYSPHAKSWWLFKQGAPALDGLEETVERINVELRMKYFHFREGFVDYWKGFADPEAG